MSFSMEIKREIIAGRPTCAEARAYGFFLFVRHFSETEVSFATESEEIARLFGKHALFLLGKSARVHYEETALRGKRFFLASLPEARDRLRLLERLDGGGWRAGREDAGAFLGGAYLSCGNMTDPEKGYHLEFVTRQEALCQNLAALLEEHIPGVKTATRRSSHVVYYKDRTQIEDLLTLMGASRSSLAMIDVEMIKEVRNRANRVTNCETANIDKTVSAAAGQIADIQLIMETAGLDSLPESLREAALLRLENPDLTLRELCAFCREPVSRSGMHHRLDKLSRIAAAFR